MKSQASHLPLDKKAQRFTIHTRDSVLAIHDNKTHTEHVFYSSAKRFTPHTEFPTFDTYGQRHGYDWATEDVVHLADWLNWRDQGYPPGYVHGRFV